MKALIKVFGFILIFTFLTSCGGGGDSGGAERLRTVQVLPPIVSATAPNDDQLEDTLPFTPTSILKSDVAKWSGVACDYVNGTYTINADLVYVKLTVIGLSNLPENFKPSPVRVDSVKITFNPSTSLTPPIPSQYRSLGVFVYPTFDQERFEKQKIMYYGYTFFSFDVVPENVKLGLLDKVICSDTIYYYYVTLEFKVIEINSGKEETVQSSLTVAIADFPESQ